MLIAAAIDDGVDPQLAKLLRINFARIVDVGGAESLRHRKALWIYIDHDQPIEQRMRQRLHEHHSHEAAADDGDAIARLHLAMIDPRDDARNRLDNPILWLAVSR